jgi:hypothetical protein
MNVVYHYGILHNNLSKDNIMLHFSVNKPNVVYTGVCNWGEDGCLQKVMPPLYGFAKEQMPPTQKEIVLVGCPIIILCL